MIMKKLLLNWRLWIIAFMLFMGILCLFAEPMSENNEIWWLQFIVSKIAAVIFSGIGLVLTKYWEDKGKLDLGTFEDKKENLK